MTRVWECAARGAAACTLFAIIGCSTPGEPDGTAPGEGLLLSSSDASGVALLSVVNEDGSGLRGLTRAPRHSVAASWSPDGRRIAFLSTNGGDRLSLYVMNSNGTGARRLTDPNIESAESQPAWSPDGNRLAYSCRLHGAQPSLCSITTTGTGRRQPIPAGWLAGSADWSPDGRDIAFSGSAPGDESLYIYSVSPDSGAPILRSPARTRTFELNPRWSPDGRQLAFESIRPGSGLTAVFLMNADGSDRRVLAADVPFDRSYAFPVWSPDGERIAYTMSAPTAPETGIFAVKLDGTDPRLIYRGAAATSWRRNR